MIQFINNFKQHAFEFRLILDLLFHKASDPEDINEMFQDVTDIIDLEATKMRGDKMSIEKVNELVLQKNPKLIDLYNDYLNGEKYLMEKKYSLFPELKKLPKNTLGYLYASRFEHQPLAHFKETENPDLLNFFRMRFWLTHDIHHVLLGVDTDMFGEMYTVGFYDAQIFNPAGYVFTILFYLRFAMLRQPMALDTFHSALSHGFVAGSKAKPILHIKWEDLFKKDIDELREELNIAEIDYDKSLFAIQEITDPKHLDLMYNVIPNQFELHKNI